MMNLPMAGGVLLSIAVHGAAWYTGAITVPPQPLMERGETVLQLTLRPTAEGRSAEVPSPAPAVRHTDPVEHAEVQPKPHTQIVAVASGSPDATLNEDKGVHIAASADSMIQPVYPRACRRRGEEGEVILSVEVLASGRSGRIGVVRSSGYARLDKAACNAVRKATFLPATHDGRSIDSETELLFTFKLIDD